MANPNQPVLQIVQTTLGGDRHQVDVSLLGSERVRCEFDFALSAQEQEDLRWYLEDYQYPEDPGPSIATRIEQRIDEIGKQLFNRLFATAQGQRLWGRLQPQLANARIEIQAEVSEATTIPWELLRDDATGTPLAVEASAFVRVQSNAGRPSTFTANNDAAIRILLVICRPDSGEDVPFRSVARRIHASLKAQLGGSVQLDVLRPPTFEQLGKTLAAAQRSGQPYHIVHFDGHGGFYDLAAIFDKAQQADGQERDERLNRELALPGQHRYLQPTAIYPHTPTPGRRGYLFFENANPAERERLVDGKELGELLAISGVPLLVLNACQSAYADPPTVPTQATTAELDDSKPYGSLAQEVVNAGVAGVVAMRYSVYVFTAAKFVEGLYRQLVAGSSLGEAVRDARRELYHDPLRPLAATPLSLQDWVVPVVYEAMPLKLTPLAGSQPRKPGDQPQRGVLNDEMQRRQPAVGFIGRDEALLALDRGFDRQQVVLLQGYAGVGKTSTAIEFAYWYSLTGGVAEGPVLFSSFERHRTLVQVLDDFGQTFAPTLAKAGIEWSTLEPADKRSVALDVLRQVPVLWLWDNVEPVAGFPSGSASLWSQAEQQELATFLRQAARDTRAKFLLTSRRDERGWLGDLPLRIDLRPMPMHERLQLTEALAAKHGRTVQAGDWRELLRYSGGNPLTITVVVGLALRQRLQSKAQLDAFAEQLRSGEADLDADAADGDAAGKDRSLRVSLDYGFAHNFSEAERAQLAVLHLFQGWVAVDALRAMGDPDHSWSLPTLAGLTSEAGIALLDRAAEVGLLLPYGGGYYNIHPALPWYFKREFDRHYAADPHRPTRAYVEAIKYWGNYYFSQFNDGNHQAINTIAAEEDNLRHAWQLARSNGWLTRSPGFQALATLYRNTGRGSELDRLLAEAQATYVQPASGGPHAGLEEEWSIVSGQLADRALGRRQWREAEQIMQAKIGRAKTQATEALNTPAAHLTTIQRHQLRSLAVSLRQLGDLQVQLGQEEGEATLKDALDAAQRSGDQHTVTAITFSLGHAYLNVPSLHDLGRAEAAYQQSLAMWGADDLAGRLACLAQLGRVALQRFEELRSTDKAQAIVHLQTAESYCQQALKLTPQQNYDNLTVIEGQLAIVYGYADMTEALKHYRLSIKYGEAQGGNLYGAAQSRYNAAYDLWQVDRNEEALLFAEAALRNYTALGEDAEVQDTDQLIAVIKQDIAKQRVGG